MNTLQRVVAHSRMIAAALRAKATGVDRKPRRSGAYICPPCNRRHSARTVIGRAHLGGI